MLMENVLKDMLVAVFSSFFLLWKNSKKTTIFTIVKQIYNAVICLNEIYLPRDSGTNVFITFLVVPINLVPDLFISLH
jgi:hypothetical protein